MIIYTYSKHHVKNLIFFMDLNTFDIYKTGLMNSFELLNLYKLRLIFIKSELLFKNLFMISNTSLSII
jgi:hypothetical protein